MYQVGIYDLHNTVFYSCNLAFYHSCNNTQKMCTGYLILCWYEKGPLRENIFEIPDLKIKNSVRIFTETSSTLQCNKSRILEYN